jgi:hypothetical protein
MTVESYSLSGRRPLRYPGLLVDINWSWAFPVESVAVKFKTSCRNQIKRDAFEMGSVFSE